MKAIPSTELEQPEDRFENSPAWRIYLAGLQRYLEFHITGQASALTRICRAVQSAELGLNKINRRPKASFLLLGPTGVGKTETVKRFSAYLYGTRGTAELIFMNEYAAETRLDEFWCRTEAAVRRNPHGTTLLFDEIEKAHPRLVDLFLSLLDEGILTTRDGERLSISQFYVVLTSNLGSGDLAKMENAPYSTMERVALDVASRSLRPELFARITERIVFRPLDLETQKEIIQNLILEKLQTLSDRFHKTLSIDQGPVTAFLLRKGYNRAQGARLLKQEVDRQFNFACLHLALEGRTPVDGKFFYDARTGSLVLR